MKQKLISVVCCTTLLLSIAQPVLAQASEDSGKHQSPFQVILTITLCAIAMKVLEHFKVP